MSRKRSIEPVKKESEDDFSDKENDLFVNRKA